MWSWEYIEYTLELREQYDAGIIDKNEIRKLLLRKFPDEPPPTDGTIMRYWEQMYSGLLGRRRQFLKDQGIRPAGYQGPVLTSDTSQPEPSVVEHSGEPYRVSDLIGSVMPFVTAFMALYMVACMIRYVAALLLN